MEQISESILRKTLRTMWHQAGAILTTYALLFPFLTLLCLLYPKFAPLLFLSISIYDIKTSGYYALLLFFFLVPLLLISLFCFIVIMIKNHMQHQPMHIRDSIKKIREILSHTIVSGWQWIVVWWMFNVLTKLLTNLFSVTYALEEKIYWVSNLCFYILFLNMTRYISFAVHYYLFEDIAWEKAMQKSHTIIKQYNRRLIGYDIVLTCLHIFVPCLIVLFAIMSKQSISHLLIGVITKLTILPFAHFTFTIYTIVRTLLFVRLKKHP